MFEKKYHLYLTEEEHNQIIGSLVELRNCLIRSGKYTDLVDETLYKMIEAKIKRLKLQIKIILTF